MYRPKSIFSFIETFVVVQSFMPLLRRFEDIMTGSSGFYNTRNYLDQVHKMKPIFLLAQSLLSPTRLRLPCIHRSEYYKKWPKPFYSECNLRRSSVCIVWNRSSRSFKLSRRRFVYTCHSFVDFYKRYTERGNFCGTCNLHRSIRSGKTDLFLFPLIYLRSPVEPRKLRKFRRTFIIHMKTDIDEIFQTKLI